ncbi:MAG: hypothetical protein EBU08_06295 [Micrococcales bacterium]|nr:hypothetical protein [Micrococcales bacterium]
MAEPYVSIAEYTASNALLTELEVATNAAASNATALSTATASALSSRNTAKWRRVNFKTKHDHGEYVLGSSDFW